MDAAWFPVPERIKGGPHARMENSEVESTTLYSKESMGILSSCSDLCVWHSDLEGRFEFRSHSIEIIMKTSVWRLSREHRREVQEISTFKSQVGGDQGKKGPQRAAREAEGNKGKQGHRSQRKTWF